MYFGGDDDDSDFMSPSGGNSKLASLFGIDQAGSQGGNTSLTYTAPKQPKKQEAKGQQPQENAPAILCATAVHAYKFVDGSYANQGKLGSAILGTHSAQDYKILLYVSKQQQVTHARITNAFNFTVQANNYASFYDDNRQSWSLMFDSQQKAIEFAKSIALCKANSAGASLNTLVSQDLLLGEGGAIESGDSAEVKYTGWLLQNNDFGQVFDSNVNAEKLFRLKVGKGKVIKGWDDGLVGMKKNGKRLLVIPPNLAYGSQGMGSRVPPNATLIFEVEVVRVKLAKGQDSTAPSSEQSPAPTPTPAEHEDDTDFKARSKSISEQLSQSPKSDKAKLISRMAKMGQAMLPGAPAAAGADTEEEHGSVHNPEPVVVDHNPHPHPDTHTHPGAAHPHPVVQPKPAHLQHSAFQPMQPVQQPGMQPVAQPMVQPQPVYQPPASQPQQQLAVYQPAQPMGQMQQPFQQQQQPFGYPQQPPQYGNIYQQQFPAQPPINTMPPTSQPTMTSTADIVLLTETRQQNTEVRISISKVSDKIDDVLKKLDHMQVHGSGSNIGAGALSLPHNTPNMETGVLMQNIQRIIQENERLKKEIFEKSTRIESQNEKIAELLQRNQKFVEQSNTLLEQRNDTFKNTAAQSQAKVLTLEQEKVQFATELSSATAQISTLQLEINNLRKRELELKSQLSTSLSEGHQHRDELNSARLQISENEKKVEELTANLREEKHSRKQTESKLSSQEEELVELKSTNETLEKNLADRKKKSVVERKKLEEELEELKAQHEEELQSLKDKLRKQKTSTDAVTAEQVAQVEAEMSKDWQQKCDRLTATLNEKHSRAMAEAEDERQQLQNTVQDLQNKLTVLKSSRGDTDRVVAELQEQVEDLSGWKEKYENLRSQAGTMKQRYEERIQELTEERDEAVAKATTTEVAMATTSSTREIDPDVLLEQVKKIMNSVFHMLRADFDADESYKGAHILSQIMNAIKVVTLKLKSGATEEESESEEEEDEEESSEEEEEEEETSPQENKEEQTKEKAPEEPALVAPAEQQVESSPENIVETNQTELPNDESSQPITVLPEVESEQKVESTSAESADPEAPSSAPTEPVLENSSMPDSDAQAKIEAELEDSLKQDDVIPVNNIDDEAPTFTGFDSSQVPSDVPAVVNPLEPSSGADCDSAQHVDNESGDSWEMVKDEDGVAEEKTVNEETVIVPESEENIMAEKQNETQAPVEEVIEPTILPAESSKTGDDLANPDYTETLNEAAAVDSAVPETEKTQEETPKVSIREMVTEVLEAEGSMEGPPAENNTEVPPITDNAEEETKKQADHRPLFGDDDEDDFEDLFQSAKPKSAPSSVAKPPTSKSPVKPSPRKAADVSPLFGGDSDDDMEGMFGGTPTKAPQEIKKQTPAKPLVNDEEEDESRKPPPPLFGDDDDDDDMDWFSK